MKKTNCYICQKEFGIPYIQRLIKTNFGFNKGKNGFVCYDCKLLGGISIPYDQQPKTKARVLKLQRQSKNKKARKIHRDKPETKEQSAAYSAGYLLRPYVKAHKKKIRDLPENARKRAEYSRLRYLSTYKFIRDTPENKLKKKIYDANRLTKLKIELTEIKGIDV